MSIEVKVPVLPESVADATIATWHKKAGDRVTRDENIVDLETDKVVLEVPAPADGILSDCLFEAGAVVLTGQVLAHIEAGKAEVSTPVTLSKEEDTTTTGPAVRRLLAEHDIAPSAIAGSGKDGRLTKEDVVSFIELKRKPEALAQPSSVAQPAAPVMGAREERRVPMSRLRAKVAERLLQAQHQAAMLTTFNEVN
ncbi:MAG: biotin/lipoyl-containing protein, partial [Legionellaceae bacterium]